MYFISKSDSNLLVMKCTRVYVQRMTRTLHFLGRGYPKRDIVCCKRHSLCMALVSHNNKNKHVRRILFTPLEGGKLDLLAL